MFCLTVPSTVPVPPVVMLSAKASESTTAPRLNKFLASSDKGGGAAEPVSVFVVSGGNTVPIGPSSVTVISFLLASASAISCSVTVVLTLLLSASVNDILLYAES